MKQCNQCEHILPLTEFHKDHFGTQGVKNSCKDCMNARRRWDVRKRLVGRTDDSGLVYFLSESLPRESRPVYTVRRFVKVGYSADYDSVLARLNDLQIGNPRPLVLLAVIENASRSTEHFIHELWADRHVRGEWFLIAEKTLHLLVAKQTLVGFRGASIRVMGDIA